MQTAMKVVIASGFAVNLCACAGGGIYDDVVVSLGDVNYVIDRSDQGKSGFSGP